MVTGFLGQDYTYGDDRICGEPIQEDNGLAPMRTVQTAQHVYSYFEQLCSLQLDKNINTFKNCVDRVNHVPKARVARQPAGDQNGGRCADDRDAVGEHGEDRRRRLLSVFASAPNSRPADCLWNISCSDGQCGLYRRKRFFREPWTGHSGRSQYCSCCSFQHPHQPAVRRVPRHADVVVRPVASSRAPAAGTDHPVGDRRGRVLADGARPERGAVRPGRPHAVQLQRRIRQLQRDAVLDGRRPPDADVAHPVRGRRDRVAGLSP